MTKLTRAEMEEILFAHGKAELEFDVDATMATVVPEPHYEIPFLGMAIDGWDAVHEMYRRLIPGNKNRNIEYRQRVDAIGDNILLNEAYVTFDTPEGERVTGLYMVLVEFDPHLKKVVGERIYTDPVFGRMWIENLGDDFIDLPGVSKITETAVVKAG
ncbi:hypothetical protein [Sphingobium sp. EM0848]|uniref:hypothetical protein n=1 Tax=Sphingobium sp. EM0848 TaxID=2743473 RepID=UPI00159C5250|nr:hypothetical protein [Sphingobium sp. EM0848]